MNGRGVTLGEEVPDDVLRATLAAVASGSITPERARHELEGIRRARPAPSFAEQFSDVIRRFSPMSPNAGEIYTCGGLGYRRHNVIETLTAIRALDSGDRTAGDLVAEVVARAKRGERSVGPPGWSEMAGVYLYFDSHQRAYHDPRAVALQQLWWRELDCGEISVAEHVRRERDLAEAVVDEGFGLND
jgi:hypothetical protein